MSLFFVLRPGVFVLAALLVPPLWTSPVPGFTVVAQWNAPEHHYAPGHRGIDLEAPTGTPVAAVAAGIVSFVGRVVDRPVVSITHADGLISSVEPVQAAVAAGQVVAAGEPIGVVGSGGHCNGRCVHLGVRERGEYISPLRFFGGIPRAVLLPLNALADATADSRVSGTRVGETVRLPHSLGRDMGVNLGCTKARMPQQLLHCSEVCSSVEQVGGSSMTEGVRTGWPRAVAATKQARHNPVHRPRAESCTAAAQEERRSRSLASGQQSGTSSIEVSHHRVFCRNTERNHSLLSALAGDQYSEASEIKVRTVDCDEF